MLANNEVLFKGHFNCDTQKAKHNATHGHTKPALELGVSLAPKYLFAHESVWTVL